MMKKILQITNPNDYARYVNAPVLHPYISILQYEEHGWVLLWSPELIHGTVWESAVKDYRFFSYFCKDALQMTQEEWERTSLLINLMRSELQEQEDSPALRGLLQGYLQNKQDHQTFSNGSINCWSIITKKINRQILEFQQSDTVHLYCHILPVILETWYARPQMSQLSAIYILL